MRQMDIRTVLLFLAVPVWLVISSAVQGDLGKIGPDGDDVMRLVQVKDLLAGQAWFDMHQYRMGPDGGTPMHWSRLADLPVLALYALFSLFMSADSALVWAYSAWPPLSVLVVVAGLYVGARHLDGKGGGLACLVLSVFVFSTHYRFAPGALDHHGLQLGLLALAIGLALDPQRRAARLAGSGLALAASVAIGGEVYVFVAAMCGFVALDWLIAGTAARRGAIGFGAGLAAGLELAFFATIPPGQYEMVACDALSSVSLLAGLAGGLGLVAAALAASRRPWPLRLGALVGVGAICVATLLLAGPQCLSNPLDDLSPEVKTLWLDRVDEARSVFSGRDDLLARLGFCLGITLLALGVSLWSLHRRRQVRAHLLFILLLVAALGMSVYQVRFYVFGHLFAVIPLGLWIADVYRSGKARNPSSVTYIGALALSLPFLWALPGVFIAPDVQTNRAGDKADCLQDDLFTTLNALPPGRVLASADFGPILLNTTRHSVLQGNYHRNHEGISRAIDLLLSGEGESRELLAVNGIDYVVTCPADAETLLLSAHDPGGLAARLRQDEVPDYLVPVPMRGDMDLPSRIFRVVPKDSPEDDF